MFPYSNVLDSCSTASSASTASATSVAENVIEITEEADLIQEERMIDDSIFPEDGEEGWKHRDVEHKLKHVEEGMLAMNLNETDIKPEENEEEWKVKCTHIKILYNTKSK